MDQWWSSETITYLPPVINRLSKETQNMYRLVNHRARHQEMST